ncbi:MAG: protease modulator HflC [Pseudomonadota bacterium]
MSTRSTILLALMLAGILVLSNSLFTVTELDRGLVLRFGKVVRDVGTDTTKVYTPGLYLKVPWVDKIVRIDSRIQTMDGEPDRIVTSEKKDVIVDTFVKWKVIDFSQFYLRTNGNIREAERLLEKIVDADLRAQIGQRTVLEAVSGEREALMNAIKINTNRAAPEYGIEIVDIRIKKINYPREVYTSVYERMRAERQRVAKEFRSEGQRDANIIRAKVDAEIKRIIADADRESREIMGNADAKAAEIYANTYNKNPEFYAFLRSLDAYKRSFSNKGDVLVIKPDSEFFEYMKRPDLKPQ